jgi:hypothetical protein
MLPLDVTQCRATPHDSNRIFSNHVTRCRATTSGRAFVYRVNRPLFTIKWTPNINKYSPLFVSKKEQPNKFDIL